MAARAMPNWTDLPLELLNEISDKLPCCVDKVRFRSVCCVWRAAVPQIRFPPVLMLPYNPYTKSISFYSLYENQVVTFPLPEAREKVLCGASKGWLVLMDESGAISLLNPITRAQVQLPPVTEQIALASGFKVSRVGGHWISHCMDGGPITLREMRDFFIDEAILSSAPWEENCVVMATLPRSRQVAYCRPGANNWTLLNTNLCSAIQYISYCFERFLAVDLRGNIAKYNIGNGSNNFIRARELLVPNFFACHYCLIECDEKLLLAGPVHYDNDEEEEEDNDEEENEEEQDNDDDDEEEDVVVDDDDDDEDGYPEMPFEIYSLNVEKGPRWEKMRTIGDSTLFLSSNCSTSFMLSGLDRCRRDCIYLNEPGIFDPEVRYNLTYHRGIKRVGDGQDEYIACPWFIGHGQYCWFAPDLNSKSIYISELN